MKTKRVLVFVASIVTLSACSSFEENIMNPRDDYLTGHYYEKQVNTEVTQKWVSGTRQFVQLQVANEDSYYTFSDFGHSVNISETYWGSLKPKTGDCVAVWARLRERVSRLREQVGKKEHIFRLYDDRNIAPCE